LFKSLRLTVLTPAQTLLDVEGVVWVQVRLADGGPISIYPGHAPLLAETVAAPLRYADASGECAISLDAGILQVNGEGVTAFAGNQTSGVCQTPEVFENGEHFDRLTRELLTTLDAQPDGVLDSETE
jgi:F0F1-type ATP synthase epsilon subunit